MRFETACLRASLRLGSAAIVALAICTSSPAWAQSDKDLETARALFVEASTLADQGRWADARERYLLSLHLRRAAITFYSLGVVDRELGRLVEAQESFRSFLAEPSAPATIEYEAPARQALAEIDSKLAEARVAEAKAPPGAGTTALITDASLLPVVVAAAPVAAPDHTLPFAFIGVGSALFVAGAVTGLVGLAQAGSASSSTGPAADSARTKGLIGDVLAGAGLAAAGAGVIVLLFQKSPAPAKTASIHPWLSGTNAGVSIQF